MYARNPPYLSVKFARADMIAINKYLGVPSPRECSSMYIDTLESRGRVRVTQSLPSGGTTWKTFSDRLPLLMLLLVCVNGRGGGGGETFSRGNSCYITGIICYSSLS